ncbi:hypothetical protein [Desulfosoma caldarium]|uniref:Uncharacterized protein n=1 Tax=Desulfosoma caldarium TaxID=610254 RepID=A0A3N1VKQ6_9BACT|nr:hypothetical protein [Desulfosoma caldarium]ROR01588.1 hypothetical protein EDC27_0767 [Desulfosoma caldarium]
MEKVFTASEVQDKMDCYGEFNRNDKICVAHCALNVTCAILKARGTDTISVRFLDGAHMPAYRSEMS